MYFIKVMRTPHLFNVESSTYNISWISITKCFYIYVYLWHSYIRAFVDLFFCFFFFSFNQLIIWIWATRNSFNLIEIEVQMSKLSYINIKLTFQFEQLKQNTLYTSKFRYQNLFKAKNIKLKINTPFLKS